MISNVVDGEENTVFVADLPKLGLFGVLPLFQGYNRRLLAIDTFRVLLCSIHDSLDRGVQIHDVSVRLPICWVSIFARTSSSDNNMK